MTSAVQKRESRAGEGDWKSGRRGRGVILKMKALGTTVQHRELYQYSVITYMGKESEKEWIYVYV